MRGQLLRRHGPADRRQRGLRPGAEDRQPPGDAKLQGPAGIVVDWRVVELISTGQDGRTVQATVGRRALGSEAPIHGSDGQRGTHPAANSMRFVSSDRPEPAKGTQAAAACPDTSASPTSRPATCSAMPPPARPRSAGRQSGLHGGRATGARRHRGRPRRGAARRGRLPDAATCWTAFPGPFPRPRALDGMLVRARHAAGRGRWNCSPTRRATGRPACRPRPGRRQCRGHPRAQRAIRGLTEPLLDYYRDRGLLEAVDGIGTVDEVAGWSNRPLAGEHGCRPALGTASTGYSAVTDQEPSNPIEPMPRLHLRRWKPGRTRD